MLDALLGPVADPAEVMRMSEADDADAVLARPGDAERHRLVADHLTVAVLTVERQQGAAVLADGDVGVDREATLQHRIDVARHHADAVRIVAAQVGLDEVVGDHSGLVVVRAGGDDDGFDGGGERRGCQGADVGHGVIEGLRRKQA